MEPPIGLEPTISALQIRRFTIKLQRRIKFRGNKIVPPKLKNSAYDAKHFKFTYYLINRVVISITALITAGLLGDELDQNVNWWR